MPTITDKTALNREHFDNIASTYNKDTRFEKTIAQLIAAVQERRDYIGVDWVKEGDDANGRTVRMIDYACGPGTISKALLPYVTQSRGIDLSPNMVAQYKALAEATGLSPDRMDAVEGNILDDGSNAALSDPTLYDADLACVSMALHHVQDPALVARKLVERLRPGGVLFVVDLLTHEVPEGWGHKEHHNHKHHNHGNDKNHGQEGADADSEYVRKAARTITHNGFSPEQVKDIFDKAGAGDGFAFELVESVEIPKLDNIKRSIFFARGTKR